MQNILDNLPLGTILTLAAVVIAFVGYLNGDLSVFEALAAAGIGSGGAGLIGGARAASGKGVKRP